jgi:predicted nucleic-acid-binding protein
MGRGDQPDASGEIDPEAVTAFVDTNILVRHLTGDPPDLAVRATARLSSDAPLLLADLILAEVAYVLESFYEHPRPKVAEAMRAIVTFPSIKTTDRLLLLRAIEVYETDKFDLAEAYLVASAEVTGVGAICSFDRSIDRVGTVRREEPAESDA